jgi:hypothetical protein
MQQLSLSRTMAAGTQQDFVEQIAAGLRSDNPEDRENACSALVNTCCKGEEARTNLQPPSAATQRHRLQHAPTALQMASPTLFSTSPSPPSP